MEQYTAFSKTRERLKLLSCELLNKKLKITANNLNVAIHHKV